MRTYRITLEKENAPRVERILSDEPLIIGRSNRADITLEDDCVSRKHASLTVVDGSLFIEDLGSCNGVLVNDSRVDRAELHSNDLIYLGGFRLRIYAQTSISAPGVKRTELEYRDVAPLHEELVSHDREALPFLYQLSQYLYSQRLLEPLLEKVLADIMGYLPAERGFVLIRDTDDEAPQLCASQSRTELTVEAPISQTLIGYVLDSRSSVLTSDAEHDARFECSDSIVAHQIKTAICVPLIGTERVCGIIYIDADSEDMPFTDSHLQFLSIVGQMAGVAVENIAQVEHRIHQERLAAIGQTVSATTHDMRNILMGITGGIELLEIAESKMDWERIAKSRELIFRSSERFQYLVDSLLTFGRKTELSMSPTPISTLINEVIEALSPKAAGNDVVLSFTDNLNDCIMMDGQQMYRVLTNLVKNSIDAMETKGGTVTIEAELNAGAPVIRVRDNGTGIEPECLEKVGQPFFSTKKENGTGLGLAASRQIMNQHQGSLEIESKLNEGTTATLRFPTDMRQTRHDLPVSV